MKNIKKMLASCALATTMLFSYAAAGCQFLPGNNGGTNVTSSSSANKNSSSKKPSTSSSKKPSTSSSATTTRYKVTFNFGDGSRDATKNVKAGESLANGETPAARNGYTFVGWAASADASASDVIAFPYKPTGDVTLYAIWEKASYTVTFDKNFAGSEAETVTVEFEGKVEAPATEPTRDGFVFQAWMNKAEDGTVVEFPYEVKENVTFYASWLSEETKTYTVSFEYNYAGAPAEALKTETVVDGSTITSKKTPTLTRDGYDFVGWNTDKNATTAVKFPYKPTADTVLYAIWKLKTYNVSFKYNYVDAPTNGTIADMKNLPYGETINAPADPTRPGYTFDGWYNASKGGDKVDFTNGVSATKSMSYYAHWKSNAVTTNIFQAEYTYIDPVGNFPGYSGAATGAQCVQHEAVAGLYVPKAGEDESNSAHKTDHGHFVGYLYGNGITLTFEIYSTAAVSGVTLKANLSSEIGEALAMAPTGRYGYAFKVNGTSLDYSITIPASDGEKLPFQEYTINTNVSLQAGWNKIELVTNNTTSVGGTMAGAAPMVDYIKFENTGAAVLSYHPVYDTLWHDKL